MCRQAAIHLRNHVLKLLHLQAAAMEIVGAEEGGHKKQQNLVQDGSVDYKGRTPVRASTGTWKAAIFIIVIEFAERLCFFGIQPMLIIYLTTVLHQEVKTAAKTVYAWSGVATVAPLLGGFLTDAYVGRFWMILISTILYFMALLFLVASELLPSLKPPTCVPGGPCDMSRHQAAFFFALYLIPLGTGGQKPSLESFGADQFDENDDAERRGKVSFFNWWFFSFSTGILFGVTVIVGIQAHIGWGAGFGVLAAVMGAALVILAIGIPFYRYTKPKGSPFMPVLQVFVAAFAKRKLPLPSDPAQLYELAKTECLGRRRLRHTGRLRFLEKAAIIEQGGEENLSPWRLTTLTRVEEAKQLLSLIPMWFSFIMFGVSLAQAPTLFVKQATQMNQHITSNFQVPPASLIALATLSTIAFVFIYDRFLVPALRKCTGYERGITILQRIGIGLALTSVYMAAAAILEKKRLESPHPISVLWLSPQFVIMGLANVFVMVGIQEFFYDQVPDDMRTMGIAFYLSVMGTSDFVSIFLVTIVDKLTSTRGRTGWFGPDLNKSRIDKFFWLLAVLGVLNFFVYAFLAKRYTCKRAEGQHRGVVVDSHDLDADDETELRTIK